MDVSFITFWDEVVFLDDGTWNYSLAIKYTLLRTLQFHCTISFAFSDATLYDGLYTFHRHITIITTFEV